MRPGLIALSLARLSTSLGIVLVICVMSLSLLSFCLLGMVGLLLIKRVALMLCKLGWFVCKKFFGLLSILDLCLLVCCWSRRPSGSLVLPTCTPFGVALPSWASPLGWFVLFGFCPLVSCSVGGFSLGCLHLWCGPGASASQRHGVVCYRLALAIGVHGVR